MKRTEKKDEQKIKQYVVLLLSFQHRRQRKDKQKDGQESTRRKDET